MSVTFALALCSHGCIKPVASKARLQFTGQNTPENPGACERTQPVDVGDRQPAQGRATGRDTYQWTDLLLHRCTHYDCYVFLPYLQSGSLQVTM